MIKIEGYIDTSKNKCDVIVVGNCKFTGLNMCYKYDLIKVKNQFVWQLQYEHLITPTFGSITCRSYDNSEVEHLPFLGYYKGAPEKIKFKKYHLDPSKKFSIKNFINKFLK